MTRRYVRGARLAALTVCLTTFQAMGRRASAHGWPLLESHWEGLASDPRSFQITAVADAVRVNHRDK